MQLSFLLLLLSALAHCLYYLHCYAIYIASAGSLGYLIRSLMLCRWRRLCLLLFRFHIARLALLFQAYRVDV